MTTKIGKKEKEKEKLKEKMAKGEVLAFT